MNEDEALDMHQPRYHWVQLTQGEWKLAKSVRGTLNVHYWIVIETNQELPDHEDWVVNSIPVHGPHAQTLPRDWHQAPDWAIYLAQDSNGAWNWHEHEPEVLSDPAGAFWHSTGQVEWAVNEDEHAAGPCYRRPK